MQRRRRCWMSSWLLTAASAIPWSRCRNVIKPTLVEFGFLRIFLKSQESKFRHFSALKFLKDTLIWRISSVHGGCFFLVGFWMFGQEKEAEIEKLESDFKTFVDGLQKQYSEASEKKDKDSEVALLDSRSGIWKNLGSGDWNKLEDLHSLERPFGKVCFAKTRRVRM